MADAGDVHINEAERPPTIGAKRRAAEAFFRLGLERRPVALGDWLFVGEAQETVGKNLLRNIETSLGQPKGAARRELTTKRSGLQRFRAVVNVVALTPQVIQATEDFTVTLKKDNTETIEIRGKAFSSPLPCCYIVQNDGILLDQVVIELASAGYVAKKVTRPNEKVFRIYFHQQRQLDFFISHQDDLNLARLRDMLGNVKPMAFKRDQLVRYFAKPAAYEKVLILAAAEKGASIFDYYMTTNRSAEDNFCFFSVGSLQALDFTTIQVIVSVGKLARIELVADVRPSSSATSDLRQRIEKLEQAQQGIQKEVVNTIQQRMEAAMPRLVEDVAQRLDGQLDDKFGKMLQQLKNEMQPAGPSTRKGRRANGNT